MKIPSLPILQKCTEILRTNIDSIRPLNGGDINEAFVLGTLKGLFFLKTNNASTASKMFEAEAAGLALIASSKALRTPTVMGFGDTSDGGFLLLEYIESGLRPNDFWEKFGTALACLHRNTSSSFGLNHDNYIGSLHQRNRQHDTWADFYIHERLLPQLNIAVAQNHLQSIDFQMFEQVFKLLPDLCPIEPPALTHGDLWNGNFRCDLEGNPVIFDPAVCYSHREMDLAMSRLFGGFERPFYRAYEAAWPLDPGFEERLPVYNLYYLLVHVNLFGSGYVGSVREALQSIIRA